MAKKKTVKNAPVKSAGNSEHDYTFKNENMGAYRFDKDCYVSMKVNRASLDVALGAIIDGETYTTTANLAGGGGGSASVKCAINIMDGVDPTDIHITFDKFIMYIGDPSKITVKVNDDEWGSVNLTKNVGYEGILYVADYVDKAYVNIHSSNGFLNEISIAPDGYTFNDGDEITIVLEV